MILGGRVGKAMGGQIITAPTDGAGNGGHDGRLDMIINIQDTGCKLSGKCTECHIASPCFDCHEPLASCAACPVISRCPNYKQEGKPRGLHHIRLMN